MILKSKSKLLSLIAGCSLISQINAAQKPADSGNALFEIGGQKYHAYVNGGNQTFPARHLIKQLSFVSGIDEKEITRKTGVRDIEIQIVDFRKPSPEQQKLIDEIEYIYGYAFKFDGHTFQIISKNAKGLNYGVTGFLREFCGYRSFGGMGHATLKPPFSLPVEFKKTYSPSVKSFTVAWGGEESFDRCVRTVIFSTHSMFNIVPPEKYGELHPEYFPLINGNRKIPDKKGLGGLHGVWQPCMSNPDLLKLGMEYADDYFAKNPDNLSLPAGVNDGGGSCHCDGCEKLKKEYGNQYVPFYNQLARVLAKKYPGKLLSFIAYGEAAQVPKNIMMEPNILVEVTGGFFGEDFPRLKAWKEAGVKHFGVYEYYNTIGGGYIIPQYYPRTAGEILKKAYKEFGVESLWIELYPQTWIFAAPRQYVIDTLAWDINAEIEPMLDEYFKAVYGPAAQPVKKLFDVFERRCIRVYNRLDQIKNYTLSDISEMDNLVSEAEKLATEREYLDKVNLLDRIYRFLRSYMHAAAAINEIKSTKDMDKIIKYADLALQQPSFISSYELNPEEVAALFVKNDGKPNPDGFKSLKRQSALQLLPWVEKQIDETFDKISENMPKQDIAPFWNKLEVQTDNRLLKTMFRTQVCLRERKLENIISNPGFEQIKSAEQGKETNKLYEDQFPFEAASWRYWGFPNSKAKLFLDTKETHSGKYSAGIGENQISCSVISDFPLNPECRYRLEFYVKASDNRTTLSGEASIRFVGKNGFLDDGSPVRVEYPQSALGGWQKVSVTFTPLPGATGGMLLLAAPMQNSSQSIWFDDVSVVKIYDPSWYGEQKMVEANNRNGILIENPGTLSLQADHAVKWSTGQFKLMGVSADKPENAGIIVTLNENRDGAPGVFSTKCSGNRITVSGAPEGVRCGLYDLLEKMGFRWYSPAESVLFPKLPIRLETADLNYSKAPSFSFRGLHTCGGRCHFDEKVAQWMSFNKMNRRLSSFGEIKALGDMPEKMGLKHDTTVHAYADIIPDSRYFAGKPAFFALVGGKRIKQSQGGQLCLSNKEMRDEFVKNAVIIADANPQMTELGICPNDGYGHCECVGCRSLDSKEDLEKGLVNGRIANFVSYVTGMIKKERPALIVGHYSYSNFADFLSRCKAVPDNLKISYTTNLCFKHGINDQSCKNNSSALVRLKNIRSKVKHVTMYEYYTWEWGSLPAPVMTAVEADFKEYKELGLDGFLTEVNDSSNSSWKSFHLPIYLAAKMLYDSTATKDTVLDDYCIKRFGSAATSMKKYYMRMENRVQEMESCFTKDKSYFSKFMSGDLIKDCMAFLEKAGTDTQWPPYKSQIRKESENFSEWVKIAELRRINESSLEITPLSWNDFENNVTPDNKALVFLDHNLLIPPEFNTTKAWVYSGNGRMGFLFKCQERNMEVLSGKIPKIVRTVDSVYSNDNIEIFLARTKSDKLLWHFIVSPNGISVASECVGKRWNWSWENNLKVVESSKNNDSWMLKLELPLSDIGAVGNSFAFSFVRNSYVPSWVITGFPSGGGFFTPAQYSLACVK